MNINNIMAKKTIYPKHLDWNINYSEREEAVLGFLQVLIPPLRAAVLFDKHVQFFSFLSLRLVVFLTLFYITKLEFSIDFRNSYFLIVATTIFTFGAFIIHKLNLIYSLGKIVLSPKDRRNNYFTSFVYAITCFIFTLFITLEFLLATVAFYLYILDVIISFVSLALKSEWVKV